LGWHGHRPHWFSDCASDTKPFANRSFNSDSCFHRAIGCFNSQATVEEREVTMNAHPPDEDDDDDDDGPEGEDWLEGA
jgi:hypothetical protein